MPQPLHQRVLMTWENTFFCSLISFTFVEIALQDART